MIVRLKGFMSHAGSEVVLPDRGVVQVTGPNGAGKSALVEAFAVALWGRGTRSSKWQPWRGTAAGSVLIDDGTLSVERRWTGKGKVLRWKRGPVGEGFDTTTKGQEALDQVVGSFEAWRRTSVFSSADAAHFTLATDAERKELLEELLGLGWFDRALQACRKDLHAARSAVGVSERDRDLLVARMDGAAKLVHQAAELLASTPVPGDVGLLRVELARVQGHVADAEAEARALEEARAEIASRGGQARAKAQELATRLSRLRGDECFTCGQAIPAALRMALAEEVDALIREVDQAKADGADEMRRVVDEAAELRAELAGLRSIKEGVSREVAAVADQRSIRDRLDAQAKAAGEQVRGMADQVLALKARADSQRVDVAELEACERVLGVRGARAHLVGRTLAGIEGLANTWMSRLGSDVVVKLSPYTEKKSGGTVDAISLGLVGAGGEAGYLGASAGERRRVDVAILLSLAELADGAAQGDRWRSPVFFDEVFDGLDDDGKEAVMELVGTIAEDRLVVLITHNEKLAADRADLRLRVDGGVVT